MDPPAPPPPPGEMPRRDTNTVLRAIETVDEQPAQVPMGSTSHFETAFITVKSIVAGMFMGGRAGGREGGRACMECGDDMMGSNH